MRKQPHLSVIMPAYNAQLYIREAIKSILDQTYTDYEFLIINDGSTDETEKIVLSFNDPRIRYFKNNTNLGLSPTLNRGLAEAKGTYIARMDADDFSFPDRFKKQIEFLDSHPDYGIVGCMYIVMDKNRRPYEAGGLDFRDDYDIKLCLFSSNVFLHGETVFRAQIIRDNHFQYNAEYNPCEDYDLWIRISQLTKFYILEDILYSYMINPDSMSGTRWIEMRKMTIQIARMHQRNKGLPYIPLAQFISFFHKGRQKKDGTVYFRKSKINRFHQLNYQEFLFRTGFVYLYRLNFQGFEFLVTSFLINPLNWCLKFYRLIFLTHPRLEKKTQ